MSSLEKQLQILKIVANLAGQSPIYLIGGAIRDTLLGKPSLDFDLMIEGDGIKLAQLVQAQIGGTLKEYPDFLTAKILDCSSDLAELDIATARTEVYDSPGALPRVTAATLEKDLIRRDFTINTLAVELNQFIDWANGGDLTKLSAIVIDKYDGLADLSAGLIRVLHNNSFRDDPTRIFRACRYVARINGTLETNTKFLMNQAVTEGLLGVISKYRILNELRFILIEQDPFLALQILFDLNVFKFLKFDPDQFARVKLIFSNPRFLKMLSTDTNDELIYLLFALLTEKFSKDDQLALYKEWNLSAKKVLLKHELLHKFNSTLH